jgi:formamidopyrimidine-DNA glycosylase
MPEGPEARTVADKLRQTLLSKTIVSAERGERAKIEGWDELVLPAEIVKVFSYGKKVIIQLSTGYSLIFSLGMTGRLQYKPGNHSHIHFVIADRVKVGAMFVVKNKFDLYFDDTRYMGGLDVVSPANYAAFFSDLGPDLLERALTSPISTEEWLAIYHKKRPSKRAIHDLLVDQSYVAGMGWYLISDILYYSGIHPERPNDSISDQDWETLRISAHQVIALSYSYGGHTIESFISPDGALGGYPAAVYGKKVDPAGNPVMNKKLKNGRTAHIVESIQK